MKFAGCYHGHLDALLVQAGQRRRDARPAGFGRRHRGHRRRHDRRAVQRPRRARRGARRARRRPRRGPRRAGRRQHGSRRRPTPGFLDGLRERCTRTGALLVFDEVITGFRVGPAGMQGRVGITPDLSIFGKVVGGGLAARRGRRPRPRSWTSSRRSVPCTKPARSRGTRSRPRPASPCSRSSTTAAYATLEAHRGAPRRRAARRVRRAGVAAQVHTRAHARRRVLRVRAGAQLRRRQGGRPRAYARLFHGLLDRGVYFAPSGYETLFPSLAHTDADIEHTIEAAAEAAASMA